MRAVYPLNDDDESMDIDGVEDYPLLRSIIMTDAFLPKSESDALHSLLMALLADPVFKQAFAISFTSSYQQLYQEYAAGIGSSTTTILAFSVQFFNRASFVKQLVAQYGLLEVLIDSVLETLRKKPKLDRVEIPFDSSWENLAYVVNPHVTDVLDIWDVFAMGIQRSRALSLRDVDLNALEQDALAAGFRVRRPTELSPFLQLAPETDLTGRFELDVNSPVFVYRRYMSGLLDLRYVLQIDSVSERFVLDKGGSRYATFLLYLSYIQGACSEIRRFGDHVEMESRGWVVTVEFVSTTSDVSAWIVSNAFKRGDGQLTDATPVTSNTVSRLAKPIFDAFFFWLASSGKYFPPPDYQVGDTLRPDQVEISISCHYPLQRALAQLIRALSDAPGGLDVMYELMEKSVADNEQSVWVHDATSPIGFWHRAHLIEPVLQAIVWDAQVHSGMWVRNGMSVINHSMNYGEPPFCLRFRDLDLLLLQFGFPLLGIDWMMASIMERFDVEEWYDAENSADVKETELMVSECLTLLAQLASELPPKISGSDPVRSLVPYLRREIVQRLCVGPCAHSDLSKIANDFFLCRENLFPPNFSGGPVLDQVLKEVCAPANGDSGATSKFQYRLKSELYAEYNPSFVHLTRKQHEFAHENWFQNRLRCSKQSEQQQDDDNRNDTHTSWLDFPLVNTFLPCSSGFRLTRLSILHEDVRRLVYESFWRALTDSHSSLSVLSKAVHLFTLQVYVVEEVRYYQSTTSGESSTADSFAAYRERAAHLIESFMEWIVTDQPSYYSDARPRLAIVQLLLKLNPWSSSGGNAGSISLDGDQKHEVGRGIDWLLHRLSRLSDKFRAIVDQHKVTEQESREEAERKKAIAQRRKDAQMRAILQMQQRQAAFAAQMKAMMDADVGADEEDAMADENGAVGGAAAGDAGDDDGDVDMLNGDLSAKEAVEPLPECAMCHSVDSENSFMCHVGFAQCSPVLSRLNGGVHDKFTSTPMDEMHVGEDVPVHVRMCGHSVHHTCWESYHASQFQRAITGGHHRHALNAVDVTKKEFLCPLCKSISNVLIPTTTEALAKLLPKKQLGRLADQHDDQPVANTLNWLTRAVMQPSASDQSAMETCSVEDMEDAALLEQKTDVVVNSISASEEEEEEEEAEGVKSEEARMWLRDGLSSLCMAVHKVACGSMQKSQPDRYTTSGCNALFHTLLCTFLSSNEHDYVRAEHRLLEAMRFLPLMLEEVMKTMKPASSDDASLDLRDEISHLLYFGGSDVQPDGTIVLESDHPSTQTQTRKQSQWGKVRRPRKPLLLNHLGSVLVKGLLLAESADEAVHIGRLVVLARMVQSLLWYVVTRKQSYTDEMAHELAYSEENVHFFLSCFGRGQRDEKSVRSPKSNEAEAADQLKRLAQELLAECGDAFTVELLVDDKELVNVIASEVIPIARVCTFLLHSLYSMAESSGRDINSSKPVFITESEVRAVGFVQLAELVSSLVGAPISSASSSNGDSIDSALPLPPASSVVAHRDTTRTLAPLVLRWVQRFRAAYDEMQDPNGVMQQWFTTANADRAASEQQLTSSTVLARDLHTMHSSISVYCSGASRTRYLRSLPRAYVKFYSELAKRRCVSCHQFPARPAVCLVCGMLLCAANTCPSAHVDKGYPEESNPGACTVHAKKCGRGSGMFLLVLEGAVLLVYWKLAAYVSSLYVDEYGEEFGERNRELSKGRPLYMNEERRERLLRLWLRHEIPNEVVKIQNSSERVIRNSHY